MSKEYEIFLTMSGPCMDPIRDNCSAILLLFCFYFPEMIEVSRAIEAFHFDVLLVRNVHIFIDLSVMVKGPCT